MNESVCSGLCVQLKGSIKECFRGSSVLGRKFGSWYVEESARRWTKKNRDTTLPLPSTHISLYEDDTLLCVFQSRTGAPRNM